MCYCNFELHEDAWERDFGLSKVKEMISYGLYETNRMGLYETIRTLGMCIGNVVHVIFCMVLLLLLCVDVSECLSCILRILNGYSLVPTSHLYVPVILPTLN